MFSSPHLFISMLQYSTSSVYVISFSYLLVIGSFCMTLKFHAFAFLCAMSITCKRRVIVFSSSMKPF